MEIWYQCFQWPKKYLNIDFESLEQYHEHLSTWEFTKPIVTNKEGQFISHDLTVASIGPIRHRHSRRRRNAELYSNSSMEYSEVVEEPHHVYLNFTALGKSLQLKVYIAFYSLPLLGLCSNSVKGHP